MTDELTESDRIREDIERTRGELGEDGATKERRLKREARKKGGGFSLEDLNPF